MTRRQQPVEAVELVVDPHPTSDLPTLPELVTILAREGLATAGRLERAAADVAGNGSPMAAHDLWRYRVELARCRQALAADERAIAEWCKAREAEVAAAADVERATRQATT